jgi:hypothetical protein
MCARHVCAYCAGPSCWSSATTLAHTRCLATLTPLPLARALPAPREYARTADSCQLHCAALCCLARPSVAYLSGGPTHLRVCPPACLLPAATSSRL